MEDDSPQKTQQRPERNFLQGKEAAGTPVLMEVERGRPSCFLVSDFPVSPSVLSVFGLNFCVVSRQPQGTPSSLPWWSLALPSFQHRVCRVPSESEGLFCLPHSCKHRCSSFLAQFSSGFLQGSSWICLLHGCPAGMVFT